MYYHKLEDNVSFNNFCNYINLQFICEDHLVTYDLGFVTKLSGDLVNIYYFIFLTPQKNLHTKKKTF